METWSVDPLTLLPNVIKLLKKKEVENLNNLYNNFLTWITLILKDKMKLYLTVKDTLTKCYLNISTATLLIWDTLHTTPITICICLLTTTILTTLNTEYILNTTITYTTSKIIIIIIINYITLK